MRPIFASLSAFALLGVVSAADVGTSCHYDFSRQELRLARGPVEDVTDHPTESHNSLQVIARDFMVMHLGQREFLSAMERGIRDVTSLIQCLQEVGEHDALSGRAGSLCATLMRPR